MTSQLFPISLSCALWDPLHLRCVCHPLVSLADMLSPFSISGVTQRLSSDTCTTRRGSDYARCQTGCELWSPSLLQNPHDVMRTGWTWPQTILVSSFLVKLIDYTDSLLWFRQNERKLRTGGMFRYRPALGLRSRIICSRKQKGAA